MVAEDIKGCAGVVDDGDRLVAQPEVFLYTPAAGIVGVDAAAAGECAAGFADARS